MQNLLRYFLILYSLFLILLLTHIHVIHAIALVLHVLPFEKIRVEFSKSPAEIKPQYLGITTTEDILGEVNGF